MDMSKHSILGINRANLLGLSVKEADMLYFHAQMLRNISKSWEEAFIMEH